MLRKNSQLGSRRLLGIMYIVAQYLGGIIAAVVSRFLIGPVGIKSIAVHPSFIVDTFDEKEANAGEGTYGEPKVPSLISAIYKD